MKLLIVGYGPIGKRMHERFPQADVHDESEGQRAASVVDVSTFQGGEYRAVDHSQYDVVFLCPNSNTEQDVDVAIEQDLKTWNRATSRFAIVSPFDDTDRIAKFRSIGYSIMSPVEWFRFMRDHSAPEQPQPTDVETLEAMIVEMQADRRVLLEKITTASNEIQRAQHAIESLSNELEALRRSSRAKDSKIDALTSLYNNEIDKRKERKNGE